MYLSLKEIRVSEHNIILNLIFFERFSRWPSQMRPWNYPTSQDYRISDHIVESLHVFLVQKKQPQKTNGSCNSICLFPFMLRGRGKFWLLKCSGIFSLNQTPSKPVLFGTRWRKEKLRLFFGDSPFWEASRLAPCSRFLWSNVEEASATRSDLL